MDSIKIFSHLLPELPSIETKEHQIVWKSLCFPYMDGRIIGNLVISVFSLRERERESKVPKYDLNILSQTKGTVMVGKIKQGGAHFHNQQV